MNTKFRTMDADIRRLLFAGLHCTTYIDMDNWYHWHLHTFLRWLTQKYH